MRKRLSAALAACALLASGIAPAYENFHVAVYCRAQEVQKMADPKWLEDSWNAVSPKTSLPIRRSQQQRRMWKPVPWEVRVTKLWLIARAYPLSAAHPDCRVRFFALPPPADAPGPR
jgi:hypothetical protein